MITIAHKGWCGKPCADCINDCLLDQSMPCSPDCEGLNLDYTYNEDVCKGCDARERGDGLDKIAELSKLQKEMALVDASIENAKEQLMKSTENIRQLICFYENRRQVLIRDIRVIEGQICEGSSTTAEQQKALS